MKGFRAILFLAIYTAFVTSSAFAGHHCNELCIPTTAAHTGFDETGTPPPYSCPEEEILNKTVTEHRHVSSVRLATRSNANTSSRTAVITPLRIHSDKHYVIADSYRFVPIYIWHCNYRL